MCADMDNLTHLWWALMENPIRVGSTLSMRAFDLVVWYQYFYHEMKKCFIFFFMASFVLGSFIDFTIGGECLENLLRFLLFIFVLYTQF